MPKERGSDFAAGPIAGASLHRTYTRVTGDQFQISQNAGMGGAPVGNGLVTVEYGRTVVRVEFGYAYFPNTIFLVLSVLVFASLPLVYVRTGWFVTLLAGIVALGFGITFVRNEAACRFILAELSKYLDSARWRRRKNVA
ncbi:MAG: hypothetical protein HKO69_00070 [Woeseiaceae bacterium]|nr:hypothetical protein [Woeseiaceae bacterium]